MSDDVRDNILSPAHWIRILYMALFAVICWVLGIILTVLVILQALFSLITGKDNENLRHLGAALSKYFYQILLFLTYKSDDKPFPFAPFPDTAAAAPLDPGGSPGSTAAGSPPPGGPENPSAPVAGARPASMASHDPVAKADFVTEHEPDPVGHPPNGGAAAEPARASAGDDVFADISFTGSRQGNGPRREAPASAGETAAGASEEGQRRQDDGLQ